MPLPEKKSGYTYADLLELDSDKHIELIYGEPVMMPTPSVRHQRISRKLVRQIDTYLDGKKCEVFSAPFAVFPFAKIGEKAKQSDTYLEPDITVVCDSDQTKDDDGCKGAPDMVIEILSPSNMKHDRYVKYNLYQEMGVKEYWIVDPRNNTVSVHILDEGQYGSPIVYTSNSVVPVSILDDCNIDLTPVFEEV